MKPLLLALVVFTAPAQGQMAASERVEFGEIFGQLYRPADGNKAPAIVIVHGSGGVTRAREGFWASELSQAGMVALVTDSFTPRGVDTTMEDQTRVTTLQMVGDARAALAYVATRPDVDPSRVAIMGFSKGGSVALLTSDRRTQQAGKAFAAHIPFYPGCTTQYRHPEVSAPVLILIGAEDNYTGVKTCADYADRMRASGASVQLKTYPGAHHGFDGDVSNEREFCLARAENYRECIVYLEDDGRATYVKTGETLDSTRKTFEVLRRDCVRRGATVGANRAAKMQALQDVKAFLKATLFQ
jgi:dienelactone hydrolase